MYETISRQSIWEGGDFMKVNARDLLQKYMEQDGKEQALAYDDEIRAEAGCCDETCRCCGIFCDMCDIF